MIKGDGILIVGEQACDALIREITEIGDGGIQWLTANEGLVLVTAMPDRHLIATINMLRFTNRVKERGVFKMGELIDVWPKDQWATYLEQELENRTNRKPDN